MASPANNEPVLYHSRFDHNVDEKRRVQIPAKWRPSDVATELTMILWPNSPKPGSHILVLAPSEMRALGEKMKGMSLSDPKAARLRRYIGENSAIGTVDKAGRMLIPESLANGAEIALNSEVTLVGLVDKGFEIWNPKMYTTTNVPDDELRDEALKLI